MQEQFKPTINEVLEVERRKFIDLTKATTILLGDYPRGSVDAVFFFGRSFFDAGKQDLFRVVTDLLQEGRANYILLAESEGERVGEDAPRVAYPGKSLWTDRLIRLGVNRDRVLYSAHPVAGQGGFNTKTEAEAFLQTAKENGFASAVILTQPHQLVRAMLSVVKAINQSGIQIDVWCMSPKSVDWGKRVKGSQGMERKPRIEHIQDEIDRIFRYQVTGEIATFDELFAYLAGRDNR